MSPDPYTLEGIHYATGRPVRLTLRNGRIDVIEEEGQASSRDLPRDQDRAYPIIAPGLLDLQVNGFMGVDFNDPGLDPDQVESVSSQLLRHGVTGYCPTLITGPVERTSRLLGVMADAIEKGGLASQMILGIHVEGPFISKEAGPRGAHPERYCTDPDPELLKRWQEEAKGWIRVLTLAPELPGSEAVIRTCRELEVVAAIGHTSAGTVEIKRAVEAGATLSTHLGNGAHGVLPRHPNYIWDQLAEDRLYASFIADGFHLPDAVLKVFMAVKGEKAILVSDSMEYSGMPPGVYDSKATGRVRLTPEGKLHREGDPGTLAGSASLLIDGVRRIARLKDLASAWNMASLHPAALLREVRSGDGIHGDRSVSQPGGDGVQAGEYATPPEKRINPKISGGHAESISTQGLRQVMPADLVLLDTSGSEINLLKVYKNGVEQLPL